MKLNLTKGLSPQEAEGIAKSFNGSKLVRERLTAILEERIQENRSESQYDKASWPYYQADQIGYRRALSEVISLLKG